MIAIFLQTLVMSFAAVPNQAAKVEAGVFELLSMPTKNAVSIVSSKPKGYLLDLETIAFSSKFPVATRWRAVSLLLQSKHEKTDKIINQTVSHKEWFIRNAALMSAGSFSANKRQEIATSLLRDKALVVRSAAVGVLGAPKDQKARDVLWEEFNAPYNFRGKQSLWVRGEILAQLAVSPLANEKPLFEQSLKEKDARLHPSAKKALAMLSKPSNKK